MILYDYIYASTKSLFLFAYLLAAIPFGVVVSLLVAKQDVRDHGSGNTGATNVSRLMGKKWGILVLFLDALKGYAVVKLSGHFGGAKFENLTAVLAVFAHCYPAYLGFKGGKGVATALGALFALSPVVVAIEVGLFVVAVLLSRRISAGSLTASVALPFIALFLRHGPGQGVMFFSALLISLLVCWKHRENAKRLWRNEEPAFF